MKFDNVIEVKRLLQAAQDVETDNRQAAKDAHLFVSKRDGQWEPYWWNNAKGRPRYTFDMTGPIIDQVAGEMEQADFNINIKPAGGDATKQDAQVYDGIIRNIENISNATDVFNHAARNMVTSGIDGWKVVNNYYDNKSFHQDLLIEPIYNFVDRVWFDPNAKKRDCSDAKYCFVLDSVGKDEYLERWPEGSQGSLSTNSETDAYWYKKDDIIIGQFYYIKTEKSQIHLLTDGRVIDDDELEKLGDELQAQGVTVEASRVVKRNKCYSRLFDANEWLTDEEPTVFDSVPVVPTYGNFKVVENKTIYFGVVEKLLDPQRVLNYSLSREIEEGALAPRAKKWMTEKQANGYEDSLQTLNTNNEPVQFYNVDPEAPPPFDTGGAQINPGLRNISENMNGIINKSAGLFAANMGDNPNAQSGIAIQKLQNKGDLGTIKYFKAQEVAIKRTARLLVDAIPKVYDAKRQIRLLKEDGSFSMEMLNDTVIDNETGQPTKVNDLSKGKYDVAVSSGPSFQNRQDEAVAGFIEAAQVNPMIMELGADVFLSNMRTMGMETIAERVREQMFNNGMIPIQQMTDEEQAKYIQNMTQNMQNQQPDPNQMIGQAELIKAQNEQAKTQIDVQEKSAKIQLAQQRENREDAKFAAEIEKSQMQAMMDGQKMLVDQINKQADTLGKLTQALGIDSVVSPKAAMIVDDQLNEVAISQREN